MGLESVHSLPGGLWVHSFSQGCSQVERSRTLLPKFLMWFLAGLVSYRPQNIVAQTNILESLFLSFVFHIQYINKYHNFDFQNIFPVLPLLTCVLSPHWSKPSLSFVWTSVTFSKLVSLLPPLTPLESFFSNTKYDF